MKDTLWRFTIAVLLAVLVVGVAGCDWFDGSSPTDPGETPEFVQKQTGMLILDAADGTPVLGTIATVNTGVDFDTMTSGEDGLTPPKLMSYDESFFNVRPWTVEVDVRSPENCGGPVGPTPPCIVELLDVPVNIDWATDPRFGTYLRGNVYVQVVR